MHTALHVSRRPQYTTVVAKYEDLRGDDESLLAVTGRARVVGHVAGTHGLGPLDPSLAQRVDAGDILVGGLDFGRDAADHALPAALKALGIAAVIARSFGDAFERHATHVGLAALVVEETAAIKDGDHLRVDVEAHIVANLSSGDRYVVRNLDDDSIAILRAGGGGAPPGRGPS